MSKEPVPTPAPTTTTGERQILAAVATLSTDVSIVKTAVAALLKQAPPADSNGAKLDEILATLHGLIDGGDPGVPPAPPVPPVVTVSDWPLAAQPAAGATATITAGAKTGAMHLDNPDVVLVGAGMRKTVIDQQGGVDGGHRLAWGKGSVHVNQNGTVRGIGIVGNYNTGGKSDGEAGFYCEGGKLIVDRCALDGCENGVFMQPRFYLGATKASVEIYRSVFGRNFANGLDDGSSHDLYLGGDETLIDGCVFAGTSRGNTVKIRANRVVIKNSFVGRRNGRFIDMPGGTDCDSAGNTYVTLPGATSQNMLGMFDENDTVNTDRAGYFRSVDDTFIFGPRYKEVVWINRAQEVTFTRPKIFWYGDAPPAVVFTTDPGGNTNYEGLVTGRELFVFNDANRLAGPPALPADPV